MSKQTEVLVDVEVRVKRNREVFTVAGEIFALLDDLETDDQREEVISLVAEWASDRQIPMKGRE